MSGGEPGPSPAESLLVAAVAAASVVVASLWVGAWSASTVFGDGGFHAEGADIFGALRRLLDDPGSPNDSWRQPAGVLPGPVAYWALTVLAFAVFAALAAAVVVAVRPGRRRAGLERRRRLGVDPEARLARGYEASPLWVPGPVPDRVVLGVHAANGKLLATENRRGELHVPVWLRRFARRHRNDLGAIGVFGPSRCGKTSGLAIPAILEWQGPVVALSVKSDLMADTIARRRTLGEVRVFDPADVTFEETARWSPLRRAASFSGAVQAARKLANATDWARTGGGDIGFWVTSAEQLLAPLLWLAARTGRGMDDVVRWVFTMDRPTEKDQGEVAMLLDVLSARGDPDVRAEAALARTQLWATWGVDFRQLSSVYVTAKAMIGAWADPTVGKSADGCDIDLGWLLDAGPDGCRSNTLYLCATLDEAHRLAPVLGGLLGDLIASVNERVGKSNEPVRRTLMVIDEAGNWPLRDLPALVSTVAGLGVQLMLVYQSLAQVTAVYERHADTLVSNILSKVFFSGVSDDQTQRYAAGQLGQEHVVSRQVSYESGGRRRSVSESTATADLLPAPLLRTIAPGEALLVHGSLRPIHLRARPWYRDKGLTALATGDQRSPRWRPSRRRPAPVS